MAAPNQACMCTSVLLHNPRPPPFGALRGGYRRPWHARCVGRSRFRATRARLPSRQGPWGQSFPERDKEHPHARRWRSGSCCWLRLNEPQRESNSLRLAPAPAAHRGEDQTRRDSQGLPVGAAATSGVVSFPPACDLVALPGAAARIAEAALAPGPGYGRARRAGSRRR